jgi:hypothetical protein
MNTESLVTAQNWTFTGFESSELLAFIHLGAMPEQEKGQEAKLLYLVTVLKSLEEEVFQLEFESLEEAINSINQRYSHWEFKDRGERSDGGGCGTCAAH